MTHFFQPTPLTEETQVIIAKKPGKSKYLVVYETGDPEWGTVERRTETTMAASPEQAVNNIWYRCGRPTLFRAMQVTAGGGSHERC